MPKNKYIRVSGEWGTIILPLKEYEKGLDRENKGVIDGIVDEKDYIPNSLETQDIKYANMTKKKKDWSCFHCNFAGTEKQVENHKCPAEKEVENHKCPAEKAKRKQKHAK